MPFVVGNAVLVFAVVRQICCAALFAFESAICCVACFVHFFYFPVDAVLALPLFGKPFVICLHLNALSFCNYSANQLFHFRFKSISICPVQFGRVIGNVWSLINEWIYPDMGSTV